MSQTSLTTAQYAQSRTLRRQKKKKKGRKKRKKRRRGVWDIKMQWNGGENNYVGDIAQGIL
jgi:hypothetical protein